MHISLPEFSYLKSPYVGDFFHLEQKICIRLNIIPKEKFSTLGSIQEVYNEINDLIFLRNYSISVAQEIASIAFPSGKETLTFELPLDVLIIASGDKRHILKPKIESVTIKRGVIPVYTINVDFTDVFVNVRKIISSG